MKNKIYTTVSVLLAILVISACGRNVATPAYGINPPQISVNGAGSVYVTPDIAYIYVGVRSEAKTVVEALSANSQLAQDIQNALKAQGVDEKDIRASSFNIYVQQYDYTGQYVGNFYVAENTVYVTVRDLDKVGELLDVVARTGANSINGVYFDIADKSTSLAETRRLAIEDAKLQAKQMADAAGVTLGKIISINLYSAGSPFIAEGKGGAGGAAPMESAMVPISTGQLVINADVTMVYEIK